MMFRPQYRRCKDNKQQQQQQIDDCNAQCLRLKQNSMLKNSFGFSHLANKLRDEDSFEDQLSTTTFTMNEQDTIVATIADNNNLEPNNNNNDSSDNISIFIQPDTGEMHPKDILPDQSTSDSQIVDIRIHLNISGRKFETFKNTLEYFPNTLLGNSSDRQLYYDKKQKEYFFERHASCFEAILYFYQSHGRLYRPKDIPIDIFIEELEFFKFDREFIMELMQRENLHLLPVAPDILPHNPYFRSIWLFFEHPTTLCAKIVSALSAFLIIISVVCACLETIEFSNIIQQQQNSFNNTLNNNNNTDHSKIKIENIFFIIEILCNIWFLIEFLFRFISCPDKIKFLKNFLNLLDLFIMLTYIFMNVIFINNNNSLHSIATTNYPAARGFNVLRILKLVRVIRLFKLTKYTKLLQVLVLTLWASKQAIMILVSTIAIGVILFASLIYYAELNDPHTDFRNIPDCFWYTINVMTTVGDSDSKPKTPVGKFLASLCAITGIVIIAIPIPVIVANFSRFYQILVENTYCDYSRVQVQQKEDEPAILH